DQYSLAMTFCELVAGVIPFRVSDKGLAQKRERKAGQVDLEFLPASLRPVMRKALSPEPNQRFTSCSEFLSAVRGATESWLADNQAPNRPPAPDKSYTADIALPGYTPVIIIILTAIIVIAGRASDIITDNSQSQTLEQALPFMMGVLAG